MVAGLAAMAAGLLENAEQGGERLLLNEPVSLAR